MIIVYLIGYDVGSSSIKAALIEVATNEVVGITHYPEKEMAINAPEIGWAEQNPADWWENLQRVTHILFLQTRIHGKDIAAIGLSYQMHGLVVVDKDYEVLRPSIIWCDSRAVPIGDKAFNALGQQACLEHCLNSPGNFTASKLKWVKEHQPAIFDKIHKIMLPGDYIALKMTGVANTTVSGLSEGILWDFKEERPAQMVLDHYGIDPQLLPEIVPTFAVQGHLTAAAASKLNFKSGIPVSYRAGDQPNNALSLNVLEPGEVAATGGTSGVVYGIVDQPKYDPKSRVNGFAHVNYSKAQPRIGVLLCINGSGILYSWLNKWVAKAGVAYSDMEKMAQQIPVGADGLTILPFGNGAERMLENQNPGAQILNLQLTRHTDAHLFRAGLEGIAFAFVYGMKILQEMGIEKNALRVGNDNLFQSEVFSNTIASLLNCEIDVIDTTGAVGAARGAGYGAGIFSSLTQAMQNINQVLHYKSLNNNEAYREAYGLWLKRLRQFANV